ncbi:DUF4142 domain-containing protein [Pontibacter arcticus]|uniref:DUF4142 domain-containing protein n=1 Tax=Pontibacter arcticus TaxID=2080288 RepID=A0A364RDA1_9BACT|nr:DUF4142 domain-containing protein [Pontibacter arcticus]RAU82136.1 DUF4142 domain-containing protein [Pontibacter arcticus]
MKKIMYYFVAGTMVMATACNSTDTATSDGTAMESSETVTAAGSATESVQITDTEEDVTITDDGTDPDVPTNTGDATGINTATGSNASMGTGTGMDETVDMAAMMNLDDPTFMMTAASSNLLEIELGKMAAQKATSPKVKEFGNMMVSHHTTATKNLKNVASQMSVTLPETMMPMHQAMVDKLKAKSGAEFDEAYMDAMETAHKMDIAMFEAKSNNASAPAVKNFAEKTLPTLRDHQKKADAIESKVD